MKAEDIKLNKPKKSSFKILIIVTFLSSQSQIIWQFVCIKTTSFNDICVSVYIYDLLNL